jgi:hypothetical protein
MSALIYEKQNVSKIEVRILDETVNQDAYSGNGGVCNAGSSFHQYTD